MFTLKNKRFNEFLEDILCILLILAASLIPLIEFINNNYSFFYYSIFDEYQKSNTKNFNNKVKKINEGKLGLFYLNKKYSFFYSMFLRIAIFKKFIPHFIYQQIRSIYYYIKNNYVNKKIITKKIFINNDEISEIKNFFYNKEYAN